MVDINTEQNLGKRIIIDKEEVKQYFKVNDKGMFKWIGPFQCLKELINDLTKNESKWTAPGGHRKLLDL